MKYIASLIPLFFSQVFSEKINTELVVYSQEEMAAHKQACKTMILEDKNRTSNPEYQLARALRTISGTDSDFIPKVPGAGEIIVDETGPYQLMHNGVKVVANCYYDSQWLTDVIYALRGHHEPQEEKCFYEVLKYLPDDIVMIELGAYWSYYSLWCAHVKKNSKNYLIEPDPKRIEVGRNNFILNGKSGVFKRGYLGCILDNDPDINGAELIRLDDFIRAEHIEHIHILHSDIQGGEADMLDGLSEHMQDIDYFFISTHGDDIHQRCLETLYKHNFVILAEHSWAQSCSGDGLIVARRCDVAGPERIDINFY